MAFVSCDPNRLGSLAAKLQALADTLHGDGMTARTLLQSWGSSSADNLPALIAELQEVATAMAGRADRARQIVAQKQLQGPNPLAPGDPWQRNTPTFLTSPLIQLPWDTQDQAIAEAAQDQSAALQNALAHPKDPGSRATIDQISHDLADNQDDPAYLQTFMKAGGLGDSVEVARALHKEDGTTPDGVVLSPDSQAIISRYASAVQTATNLAASDKNFDIGDYQSVFTNPPNSDMWSMSQLLAGAPVEANWQPALLDAVGTSVLAWRAKNSQRPGVRYPSPGDPAEMPTTFDNDDGAWYNSLGLAPGGNVTSPANALLISGIKQNDPALTILQVINDNQQTTVGLLSDPAHGLDNAKALVSNQWAANFDGSSDAYVPAQIITNATQGRGSGSTSQLSATAAANVMQAAQALYITDKKSNSGQPSAPPEISDALEGIACTYLDDLARSATVTPQTSTGTDNNPTVHKGPDGQWAVTVNQGQINGLLAEAFANGGNVTIFNNAIQAGAYNAVSQTLAKQHPYTSYDQYASLLGISFTTQHAVSFYDGQSQDDAAATANAADQAYVNAITGTLGNAPLDGMPLGVGQALLGFISPFLANRFGNRPTDNAQKASDTTQKDQEAAYQALDVPALQALMDAGQVKMAPPPGVPWYQNGKILPNKVDTSFYQWTQDNWQVRDPLKPYDQTAAQNFKGITGQTNPSDSQFGNNP